MDDSAWHTFQELAFAACVLGAVAVFVAVLATRLYILSGFALIPAGACLLLWRADQRRHARFR
jgi:Flp pilus assembly protein TadB